MPWNRGLNIGDVLDSGFRVRVPYYKWKWGNDLLSGGETQLIYVNSPAAISLLLLSLYQLPTHACTPSPSFLISLIIPHQNMGGGGGDASFTGGLSPSPQRYTHNLLLVSRHSSFHAWWLCSFITVLPAEQMIRILNN